MDDLWFRPNHYSWRKYLIYTESINEEYFVNLTRVKPDDKLKHPGVKTFSEFVQDLNDLH